MVRPFHEEMLVRVLDEGEASEAFQVSDLLLDSLREGKRNENMVLYCSQNYYTTTLIIVLHDGSIFHHNFYSCPVVKYICSTPPGGLWGKLAGRVFTVMDRLTSTPRVHAYGRVIQHALSLKSSDTLSKHTVKSPVERRTTF